METRKITCGICKWYMEGFGVYGICGNVKSNKMWVTQSMDACSYYEIYYKERPEPDDTNDKVKEDAVQYVISSDEVISCYT